MTTLARVDATLARFDRKSPRDAYKQVCGELEVHMQREIYNMLPDAPSSWHRVLTLELNTCLLGSRGCMAILPIITACTTLRKLTLRTCGITDEFVKEMCDILQTHPSVRAVDISKNDLVTVYSAPYIISVMRNNSNIVSFEVEGTHVGENVGSIITELGLKNMFNVSSYYEDNYFKMKDLFGYLDENGQGWVPLKSLVMNCPYPVLQEQFIERIGMKKPRKRSDNTISTNTFMELVYMNYKTEAEIKSFVEETIDEPYVFLVANWKQILAAVERYNEQHGGGDVKMVCVPADLHRVRIRDYLLNNEFADAMIHYAIDAMEVEGSVESSLVDGKVQLKTMHLVKAARHAYATPPSMKPVYQFFKDRDAGYIPNCLRSGSRLLSVRAMSMLEASSSNASTRPGTGTRGGTAEDPSDPTRTFSLPPSIVKMIVDFFNREFLRLPKKKQSIIPETPRTRRDKAMEKAAIPIRTFLSAEFITDLEKVCPRLLADYYSRYSLPIDDCTITMQEMVNVLDEMYVQTRIDAILTLEQIEKMENPLKESKYTEFLTKHLMERADDVDIFEPFGEPEDEL